MTFPSAVYLPELSLRYALEQDPVIEPPGLPPLWLVKHDALPLWRVNLPEVHQLAPAHYSKFGEGWQRLERALNAHLSDAKWHALHGYERAFNNGTHGYKEGRAMADYINGWYLTSPSPDQEALVGGGALLAGYSEGNNLVVDTLDASGPVPRMEDLKPWQWFTAVNIDEGYINGVRQPIIRRFLNGEEAFILLLADRRRYPKVTLPLSKVMRWPGPGLPSPYEIYL